MLLSWSLFNVLAKVSNAKIMGLNFKPTCASECASYCAAEPELWLKVYMSLRSSSWSSWPSTVMDPWIKQQHTYVQTHSYGPEPKNEHNYWAAYNIHHFMEKKWTIKQICWSYRTHTKEPYCDSAPSDHIYEQQ